MVAESEAKSIMNTDSVPSSIKLYKVDNHYENVMGSMKSS